MKKIILVMTTVFSMLLIMAFICYGQTINGCYQKENGQLRILTYQKDCKKDCDKGHNKNCDKDYDKDCDKDGYTSKCKPSEIPITLQGGGLIPDVPRICAGTVGTFCNPDAGMLCITLPTPSCVKAVDRLADGKYQITFTESFSEYPVCTFYAYPDFANPDPNFSTWYELRRIDYYVSNYYQPPGQPPVPQPPYYQITVKTGILAGDGESIDRKDTAFNFICTELQP